MCRNIKPLFNFEPPATGDEVHEAALQFVRKISGYTHPSKANEAAFEEAVEDIEKVVRTLLKSPEYREEHTRFFRKECVGCGSNYALNLRWRPNSYLRDASWRLGRRDLATLSALT